jgi:imidazole glycerol-phosphate synthase subunit HisF
MLRPRLIPCLLLHDESLVKTVRFGPFSYVGDPANTCRIFSELEVDELCLLDISPSRYGHPPNFALLADITSECFMPVSYGGGITSLSQAEQILKLGFEKLVINTAALRNPQLITEVSKVFGSQSLVGSIDVRRRRGRQTCWGRSARIDSGKEPVDWARQLEAAGAGELLLTCVDREGTWEGIDVELTARVTAAVSIPVIAHGGAGSLEHIDAAIRRGGASAVCVGSMVVYQKQGMGVLVNFPDATALREDSLLTLK